MAIKLPGPENLSATPSGQSGRPIATVNLTGPGRGLEQAGQGIAQAGGNIISFEQTQQTKDDQTSLYDATTKWNDIKTQQRQLAIDAVTNMKPGGGGTEAVIPQYKEATDVFWKALPPKIQQQMAPEIHAYAGVLDDYLHGKVTAESTRFNIDQQGQRTDKGAVVAAMNPGNVALWTQQRDMQRKEIEANPNIPPIEKQQMLQNLDSEFVKKTHDAWNQAQPVNQQIMAPGQQGAITPSGQYQTAIVNEGGAKLDQIDPSVKSVLDGIQRAGVVKAITFRSDHAGFRTEADNEVAGGAKQSMHRQGKALDLSMKDYTDDEKAAVLRAAIAGGARGIGIYPGGALHIDTRAKPAFWGTGGSYASQDIKSAPAWARPILADLFAGKTGGDQTGSIGTAPAGDAAGLLKRFEGFSATPYYDTNAYRVGYGSDTVTLPDGTVKHVSQGMTITKADADRDLNRRIGEFQQTVVGQLGQDRWGKLSAGQQAALTSVAYNYGSLPANVVTAAETGDAERLAQSVESLGANKDRRRQEAAIIRGGGMPAGATGAAGNDNAQNPYQAGYAYWHRLAPDASAEALDAAARGAVTAYTQGLAQQQAQNVALQNQLQNQLIDGKAGYHDIEQARQAGWLGDADTVEKFRGIIEKRDKDQQDARNFFAAAGDRNFQWNPLNADQQKGAEAGYQAMGANMQALDQIYQKTGIVPKSAAVSLRGALVGTDSEKAGEALQVISNILAKNPNGFAGVADDGKLAQAGVAYQHYLDQGFDTDAAVRRVMDANNPALKPKVNVSEPDVKAFTDGITAGTLSKAYDQNILPFIGNPQVGVSPDQQTSIIADFREVAGDFYKQSGDASLAMAQARAQLDKVYGVTSVFGGLRVMKYPPEKTYPPVAGSQAYVIKQATADVIRAVGEKNFDDWRAGSVTLLPIPGRTEAAFASGKPVPYMLSYQTVVNGQPTWNVLYGKEFTADVALAQKQASEGAWMGLDDAQQKVIQTEDNFAKAKAEEEARARATNSPILAGPGLPGVTGPSSARQTPMTPLKPVPADTLPGSALYPMPTPEDISSFTAGGGGKVDGF